MVVASALTGKQQLQVSEPQTFEKEQNIVCIHVKRFGFKTENSSYKAGKRSTHNLSLLQSSDMPEEDPIAFKGCLDKLEPRSVQTFSPLPSLIQVLLNLTKAMSVNKSRLNFNPDLRWPCVAEKRCVHCPRKDKNLREASSSFFIVIGNSNIEFVRLHNLSGQLKPVWIENQTNINFLRQ